MYYYEEVMALKVNLKDGLPHYFCYECATLLHKFHKFKEKCYRGQKALKEMIWKGAITYEVVYKVDRTALNLQSPLEVLTVNNRVKTYVTNDSSETEDIKEETAQEIEYNRKLSYRSSFTDCDDNGEPEIDLIEQDTEDEKPLLSDADKVEITLTQEEPCSPTTVFIDEKKQIVKMKNETIKDSKESVITITPNAKKYRFVSNKKNTRFLDANHWRKVTLTEEEAVKEFRARAEDQKYLAASFKCTSCFKGFSKLDMLTRHLQLRHNEALGPNECRFCRMRFKWDCLLRKHMRQHFTKYECLRCHLVCPLEHTALLHEDSHNGVTTKCIHCGEEFRHRSTYYTHLRTHRSDYVCTLCGVSFVSELGLHQHKKVKHVTNDIESPDDDEDVNSTCVQCNITFETNKAYVEHLFHSAMHSDGLENELQDEYSLPRKVLGKKEQSKITKELLKRKSVEEPIIMPFKKRPKKPRRLRRKPMDCHQCGKHFETQAACMRHHIAEHPRTSFFPSTERHICEICGASLAPGSVAMHQNMHTRSKMFSCDTCGRTFHSNVGLKRHLVTHTGEKPFACSLCDKRFTQSNSMKLHYRTFHLKQPYPKRNRRKKKDEPHTTAEDMEESKSDESSDESVPEQELRPLTEPGLEPVPQAMQDRTLNEDNIHYLTLS
ncbi:hypothetical protein evm_003173 [Chilo suppressalis]|nr:hypothetical protein evm_003173 [Chilo suppressalis]